MAAATPCPVHIGIVSDTAAGHAPTCERAIHWSSSLKRKPINIKRVEKTCGTQLEGLQQIRDAVTAGKKVVFIGGAKWAVLKWLETASASLPPQDIIVSKADLKISHIPTRGELTFIGNRDDLEDWLKSANYDCWSIGAL